MGPKRAPNAKPRRTKEAATLSKQLQAAHAGLRDEIYEIRSQHTAAINRDILCIMTILAFERTVEQYRVDLQKIVDDIPKNVKSHTKTILEIAGPYEGARQIMGTTTACLFPSIEPRLAYRAE